MFKDYRKSIIGRNAKMRLPELGTIRPGIRMLKEGCSEADKAIYNAMVAEGRSWDEISDKLGKDSEGKQKLKPHNENYFTIREIDCKINPANARKLHELYADPDGHIRSLPIVLASDDWFEVCPHHYQCWTGNKLKYISDFKAVCQAEGEVEYERICTTQEAVARDSQGNVMRPTGPRGMKEVRPCVPEECQEFQKRQCSLKGCVWGIIPGTSGLGLWRITTGSIYSFTQMMEQMELTLKVTGRLSGLYKMDRDGNVVRDQNGHPVPIFTIRKVEDTVSRIDDNPKSKTYGQALAGDQDLVHLFADIDVSQLMVDYQPQRMVERGQKAQALLAGNPVEEATTRPALADPEKPAPRQYDLKHVPPVQAPPETRAAKTTADPKQIDDDFIPEIEVLGEDGEYHQEGSMESTEEEKEAQIEYDNMIEGLEANLKGCRTAQELNKWRDEFMTAKAMIKQEDANKLKFLFVAKANEAKEKK